MVPPQIGTPNFLTFEPLKPDRWNCWCHIGGPPLTSPLKFIKCLSQKTKTFRIGIYERQTEHEKFWDKHVEETPPKSPYNFFIFIFYYLS